MAGPVDESTSLEDCFRLIAQAMNEHQDAAKEHAEHCIIPSPFGGCIIRGFNEDAYEEYLRPWKEWERVAREGNRAKWAPKTGSGTGTAPKPG
jgi:hypothetical protein